MVLYCTTQEMALNNLYMINWKDTPDKQVYAVFWG